MTELYVPDHIELGSEIFLAGVRGDVGEIGNIMYTDQIKLEVEIMVPKLQGSIVKINKVEIVDGKN